LFKECERTKVLEIQYKRLAIELISGNALKVKVMLLMSVTWLKPWQRVWQSLKLLVKAFGSSPAEFTMGVLEKLKFSTPEMRSIWYEAFKHCKYPEDVGHSA